MNDVMMTACAVERFQRWFAGDLSEAEARGSVGFQPAHGLWLSGQVTLGWTG
ncbi:hypothetical protein [Deinococcus rubellus]|uniref:hypothetical protein n=1 Tax=Deinococcus rubellus TaxID=1889240 RepID=UPI0031F0F985